MTEDPQALTADEHAFLVAILHREMNDAQARRLYALGQRGAVDHWDAHITKVANLIDYFTGEGNDG